MQRQQHVALAAWQRHARGVRSGWAAMRDAGRRLRGARCRRLSFGSCCSASCVRLRAGLTLRRWWTAFRRRWGRPASGGSCARCSRARPACHRAPHQTAPRLNACWVPWRRWRVDSWAATAEQNSQTLCMGWASWGRLTRPSWTMCSRRQDEVARPARRSTCAPSPTSSGPWRPCPPAQRKRRCAGCSRTRACWSGVKVWKT
mmetsp:Transcript_21220/g.63563  ORF Transcript_21220/g.63563 Transcript_21220/m.63563 type:complete len:202 (-) Transcript_21220:259-864(-)